MQELLSSGMDNIVGILSERGLGVVGAIVILIIGRIVAGSIRKAAKRSMDVAKVDTTLVPFLTGITYFVTMAIVVVMALGTAGFPTGSLVVIFGAAGLAIALAFQDTISNFASGVMLLIFRPISVGDRVEVVGQSGSVVQIDIFTTTMNTGDNVRIVVPNGQIFGQIIKNYTANDTRRIDLIIGVDYGDDLGKAIQVINDTIRAEKRVLAEPAPVVEVHELGDSSVNFVVRPWCRTDEYWPTRWALMKALKEQIEAAGLSFPFPQRDVHLFQEVG